MSQMVVLSVNVTNRCFCDFNCLFVWWKLQINVFWTILGHVFCGWISAMCHPAVNGKGVSLATDPRTWHLCTRYSCAFKYDWNCNKRMYKHRIRCTVLCCFPELTRCQIELNELQRLVQKLHSLESGQMVNNGDLPRIISMQVGKSSRLKTGLY